MAQNDPTANHKPVDALLPTSITTATTTNGVAVDTKGWRWATVILQLGSTTDITVDSATVAASATSGGAFVAVTDAAFTVTMSTIRATRIDLHKLAADATQRWIRIQVVTTTAGGSADARVSGCMVLSGHDDSTRQSVTYDFSI